jgi:enoyl-CoA hydratase / 3-hydroxyacyl-CoA dehydrogenase
MSPQNTTSYANPLLVGSPRGLPKAIAVIGAGTIGPDIAYYLKSAIPGLTLYLVDVVQPALDAAMQRIRDYAAKAVQKKRMSQAEADDVLANLHATLDYEAIAGVDWVLEAATEDIGLKRKIFARVEAIVRPDAVITSNTSSLPAAEIFSGLAGKGRATVTHFFAPAWRNPIVEVIRWPGIAPDLVEHLRWLFCMTGKVPLVIEDVPCFMLDRVFDNWCNEAAYLLDQATAAEIDSTVSDYVQAGPFFVLNLANGNPIIVETNTLQAETEGEHYRPAPIFRSVKNWVTVPPGKTVPVQAEVAAPVRDRMLGILFSQSADILDRGIGTAADLELGCRLALAFKSGPLDIMGELGEAEVNRILARLAAERPGLPLPRQGVAAYQDFQRTILVDQIGDVRVITLRRPEALNALHDGLTDEILQAIREGEADASVAGFVITGYGPRAFSAGADIGRFPRVLGDAEAAAQYARDCSRLLVHLDGMKKPVVAALNGMALGGGLELALRCHDMVAVRDAWLQLPEITLGIVPGIGAMVVPYRRWPNAAPVFHDMLRRAEKVTAVKAADLGMVSALADDYAGLIGLAMQRVHALVGKVRGPSDGAIRIAPLAPAEAVAAGGQRLSGDALRIMVQAIEEAAAAPSFGVALEVGYRAFGASACTAAAREGIDAFQQKRRPDFEKTG